MLFLLFFLVPTHQRITETLKTFLMQQITEAISIINHV